MIAVNARIPGNDGVYTLNTLLRDLQALKSVGMTLVEVEIDGQRFDVVRLDRAGEDNATVVLGCSPERG